MKNSLLLMVTIFLSLLLSEIIVRQFFHPVDFLLPQTVSDSFLGHRVSPGTGGHDEWGFRNYSVPSDAEIVAIGDSQTYGISATFQESWPNHLSKIKNARVYNLALGGYGPLQYLHLLRTKALDLQPDSVVVGLYFGNDLIDTYRLAYSNENYSDYRDPLLQDHESESMEISSNRERARFLGDARNWLAHRSVLYRIITQSILGDSVRKTEFKNISADIIDFKYGNVQHLFIPSARFSALDIESQEVSEGIRISKQAFKKIKSVCQKNQIQLIVALIPTKELVYSELLKDNIQENFPVTFTKLFENENTIRTGFMQFFEKEGIQFVDSLPALKKAASQGKDIYPMNDGHTNGNGYLVIAREISNAL